MGVEEEGREESRERNKPNAKGEGKQRFRRASATRLRSSQRRAGEIGEAQLNHFARALHESVEVFRLGVATSQAGNCGDVTAVFISFNDDREFAGTLHKPILA